MELRKAELFLKRGKEHKLIPVFAAEVSPLQRRWIHLPIGN